MNQDSEIRSYIQGLYEHIYKHQPTEAEEQEFAQREALPVLMWLYRQRQAKKETAE